MSKKIYILFVINLIILLIGNVYGGSEKSSGYNQPIYSSDYNFQANYTNGGVYMSWTPIDYEIGQKFKYYKIVKSSTNANPVYPQDGYIAYFDDITKSSYVDNKIVKGKNHYRICAIYDYDRYCSNVVSLNIEDSNDSVNINYPSRTPNLSYKIDGSKINFSRTEGENKDFLYYKLNYSKNNKNPIYPKDEVLFVGDTINTKSTTVYGKTGYRSLCYVYGGFYNNNDMNYVKCSNGVYINIEQDYDQNYEKAKQYLENILSLIQNGKDVELYSNKLKAYLSSMYDNGYITLEQKSELWTKFENNKPSSDSTKAKNVSSKKITQLQKEKLNNIFQDFKKKLDEKFTDNSKKILVLDKVIDRLQSLSYKNPSSSEIVNYMMGLVNELYLIYDDGLDQIESIFDF